MESTIRRARVAVSLAGVAGLAAALSAAATPATADATGDAPALAPGSHIPATELTRLHPRAADTCSIPSTANDGVLLIIERVLDANNATSKVRLATYETAWVESHVNDLNCGDRDSVGVFQQRASVGWTRGGDPELATYDFLHGNPSDSTFGAIQWAQAQPTWDAWQIAQGVQRSAYPERYDQAEAIALNLKARAERLQGSPDPTPRGWTSIVSSDLDGDGDDEVGYYRQVDGLMQWYEMTSTGGLGTRLESRTLSPTWTSILSADLDGNGDDEVGFYRTSDGTMAWYPMTATGGLGTRLSVGTLSPTWTSILSADLDGNGDDEVGFYRTSDGTMAWYPMTATGGLGTRLDVRTLSPTWTSILSADLDGNGKHEVGYYRRTDGTTQWYRTTSTGALGARLTPAGYTLAAGWTQVLGSDFDGDTDGELAFYRNTDGQWVTYEGATNGTLGTRLTTSDLYP